MNKKLKIALWIIFGVLAIAYVVLYIVFKDKTLEITNLVIDFVNKPLPIIGVSTVILCIFIYKCVIATRFGKKRIGEYKELQENTQREVEELKKIVEDSLKDIQNKVDSVENKGNITNEKLLEALRLSRNVKIQALAEGDSNGEEINSDQEEE